jgi:hypothetical protein
MKELISCCGINCENCEARVATVNNDDNMRKEVAEKWSAMFNSGGITPESINCTGCRMEGVKFAHCLYTCEIRKCVQAKGFGSCAECAEIDACQIVAPIFGAVPDARTNLQQLLN